MLPDYKYMFPDYKHLLPDYKYLVPTSKCLFRHYMHTLRSHLGSRRGLNASFQRLRRRRRDV